MTIAYPTRQLTVPGPPPPRGIRREIGDLRVFWQGPTIGVDLGADGARTMMLVYNLPRTDAIYQQFNGIAGDTALEFAAKAKPLLWSVRYNIQSVDYCLYLSLALAAVIPTAPPGRRTELREAFTSNLRSLERWAESYPESFSHKYELVAAEAARLEGREIEAMRLYEQAIRAACANGFIHDEAIAYEVAARFYAAQGFGKMADAYLLQARSRYVRWGAEAKVQQLGQQCPQLQQERPLVSSTSTIAAPVEHLDLATVIKVSQSVSGELVLEKLIDRVMRAALEHAGAQRGLLINPRNDELRLEAEATTRGEDLTVNWGAAPTPLPCCRSRSLSM